MSRKHHGFTLVEMLVVIAIITVLMTLLLPVIVRSRESEDPLKRLGPGMHQPAKTPGRDTLPLPTQPGRR